MGNAPLQVNPSSATMMPAMRWVGVLVDNEIAAGLSRQLNVAPVIARLLVRRGVREPEAADRFLHPSLGQLHDPFLMADMRAAVERLRRAIDRKEKILIYGDYDVDGTMAGVLLLTALRSLRASVGTDIPHRLSGRYGMRASVLGREGGRGGGGVGLGE